MTGYGRFPPVCGRAAERQNGLFRAFPLAPGGQHAAGEAGGTEADLFGAFGDGDVEAVAIELPGDGEAGNAGPFDEDAHGHSPAGASASGM